MSDPSPSEELLRLIELEKNNSSDPGPARARLEQRLAPHLNADPKGQSESHVPGVRSWKIPVGLGAGLFGAGIATGALLHNTLKAPAAPQVEVRYVDRVVEVERAKDEAPDEEASTALTVTPAAADPTQPGTPPSSSVDRGDESLGRERQLIDKARSALSRHDPDAALRSVNEHAKAFPGGRLSEMREAIAVQALVVAGRSADARTRAKGFHSRFPGSVYGSVVDNAISSIP